MDKQLCRQTQPQKLSAPNLHIHPPNPDYLDPATVFPGGKTDLISCKLLLSWPQFPQTLWPPTPLLVAIVPQSVPRRPIHLRLHS